MMQGSSMTRGFKLRSDFSPKGDQPEAISLLSRRLDAGERYQTLLGITGSGKTFTVMRIPTRGRRSRRRTRRI